MGSLLRGRGRGLRFAAVAVEPQQGVHSVHQLPVSSPGLRPVRGRLLRLRGGRGLGAGLRRGCELRGGVLRLAGGLRLGGEIGNKVIGEEGLGFAGALLGGEIGNKVIGEEGLGFAGALSLGEKIGNKVTGEQTLQIVGGLRRGRDLGRFVFRQNGRRLGGGFRRGWLLRRGRAVPAPEKPPQPAALLRAGVWPGLRPGGRGVSPRAGGFLGLGGLRGGCRRLLRGREVLRKLPVLRRGGRRGGGAGFLGGESRGRRRFGFGSGLRRGFSQQGRKAGDLPFHGGENLRLVFNGGDGLAVGQVGALRRSLCGSFRGLLRQGEVRLGSLRDGDGFLRRRGLRGGVLRHGFPVPGPGFPAAGGENGHAVRGGGRGLQTQGAEDLLQTGVLLGGLEGRGVKQGQGDPGGLLLELRQKLLRQLEFRGCLGRGPGGPREGVPVRLRQKLLRQDEILLLGGLRGPPGLLPAGPVLFVFMLLVLPGGCLGGGLRRGAFRLQRQLRQGEGGLRCGAFGLQGQLRQGEGVLTRRVVQRVKEAVLFLPGLEEYQTLRLRLRLRQRRGLRGLGLGLRPEDGLGGLGPRLGDGSLLPVPAALAASLLPALGPAGLRLGLRLGGGSLLPVPAALTASLLPALGPAGEGLVFPLLGAVGVQEIRHGPEQRVVVFLGSGGLPEV